MKNREKSIRVGVVGAGAMGRGIAFQVNASKGMDLVWVIDKNLDAAQNAVDLTGAGNAGTDLFTSLKEEKIDVLVEATNSIEAAAQYCIAAIENKVNVVLMNAEVDLALRPLLDYKARENGVCVTSDAGDQHGVLAVMIEEAEEMGFEVVQAGNIKGFLDKTATPESIKPEADKRNLSAEQCCAYTDGSKLHIEMAMLANAFGYLPPEGGMKGPRAEQVHQALELFDFESYGDTPRIDYLLGAEPGGGVYLVVKPQKGLPEQQAFYLNYYKLGEVPYYILYRPYHLCHLETPKAIKRAYRGESLLSFDHKSCDVYAYAKRPLKKGEQISHAIGSSEVFGEVVSSQNDLVPMVLLENSATLKNDLEPDAPITWSDVELLDTPLLRYWKQQEALYADE